MNRTRWALLAGLCLFSANPAEAAFVFFPTTGHWYDYTFAADTWTDAQAEAVGRGGHLVTINSAAEQAFLVSGTGGPPGFLGFLVNGTPIGDFAQRPLWIGGLDPDPPGGGYEWVTGEPFGGFTNFYPGEPNGPAGGERFLTMNWHFSFNPSDLNAAPGQWNDVENTGTSGFGASTNGPYFGIIEVENPSAVPEPTSLAMLGLLAATGAYRYYRRQRIKQTLTVQP